MKKILILLLSLMLLGGGAYIGFKALFSSKNTIEILANGFGTEPVEPEYQQLISSIKDELGITRPIEIRKMNSNAMRFFGRWNLFAYFDSYIFIGPNFFSELTPAEQRFVIGHELMHIKNGDTFKRFMAVVLSLIISILLTIVVGSYLKQRIKRRSFRFFAYIVLFCIISNSNSFLMLAYYRWHEYQADYASATQLQCKQAGIEWCNRQLKYSSTLQQQQDLSTVWNQLRSDHPSYHKRIAYLEAINPNKELL